MDTRERKSLPGRPHRRLFTALLCLLTPIGTAGAATATPLETHEGVPAAFREILEDPRISEALVWDGTWEDGAGPRAYPRWDERHREELHRELAARNGGEAPVEAADEGPIEDGRWLSPETGWRVYLAHAAHALWLEHRREVPWSLRSLTPDQLALLLDGRNLLEREPVTGRYAFGPSGAVATWSPRPVFELLRKRELLTASQEETVHAVTDWARRSIAPGPPPAATPPAPSSPAKSAAPVPVALVLEGDATGRPTISGCHALSGVLAAALRSVNVPVRVAASPFALRGGEATLHSRIELPTLGRGLAHSYELHAHLALQSGNAIPTGALFPTLGWIRDHVEAPRHLDCTGASCHTEAEQALFNSARRLLALAAIHLPDGLLIDRAGDESASAPPGRLFHTLASGCFERPVGSFVRPLFEEAERREIARRADQEIERAGGGDWARGAETVRRRWQRALENR